MQQYKIHKTYIKILHVVLVLVINVHSTKDTNTALCYKYILHIDQPNTVVDYSTFACMLTHVMYSARMGER